jgi:predicted enzyme related to lactoylglutathione lyase
MWPMPDPFDALRTAPTPIHPDPVFAARLRARVEQALHRVSGGESIMSTSVVDSQPTASRVQQGDITYVSLWVPDVRRAAEFFESVLAWTYAPGEGIPEKTRRVDGLSVPHGIVGVADAVRELTGRGLELRAPERSTMYLFFAVDNIETAIERVRAGGGQALAPEDGPHGRVSDCVDDQGMPFGLHQVPAGSLRATTGQGRQGDVAYITLEVTDSTRARVFFGAVMGLQFTPGRAEDGWNVNDILPMSGLQGGHHQTTVVPMYRVDHVGTAVERVRAAGGTASDPAQQPYGFTADCTDDQGTHFYLGQL